MTPPEEKALTTLELANAAFDLAMRRVVERAERYGTKVILWRDNQIVRLSPDDPSLQQWRKVER